MAQQPSQQQFGMQSSQSASGLQHSSMSSNPPQALGNVAGGSSSNLSASTESANKEKLEQLVLDLVSTEKREKALLELSKARETYKDLAPVLWYSFGTIAALLQEIVSI
ncbi:hypothetical protein IE077_004557 [Cardiosporidium cionae]|uniref:Cell differentiation protein rcd1 n=1 Tax=Cardiosporidium cionae TaxID=476202 RepID=A0ABQ7J7U9_9APIC|nr:hypothetical protein IE077_004557 [Cardiosporidium cionae]|eukprot:KAF8820072.1 hypothetical protein IE077_004557 [Cardiosporidium cionae]